MSELPPPTPPVWNFRDMELAAKPYAYELNRNLWLFFPVCPQVATLEEPK